MYQDRDERLEDNQPPEPFLDSLDLNFPSQDAYSGELQHLFRSHHFNLTTGAGYFDIDADLDDTNSRIVYWYRNTVYEAVKMNDKTIRKNSL